MTKYIIHIFQLLSKLGYENDDSEIHNMAVGMTAEMTADYIMIIWFVEMTAEMTAGFIKPIRWLTIPFISQILYLYTYFYSLA